MIAKQLLGIMLIVTMMIVAVMSESAATIESAAPTFATMEIRTPIKEDSVESTMSSQTIVQNTTTTGLQNYQYVSVNSLPGYAWNYYYIDLYANSYVSITHANRGGNGALEILMDYNYKPTAYVYSKRSTVYSYQGVLSSDAKSYYHRVYIAVRNTNAYTSYGYTLSVRVNTVTPTPTPTPGTTVVYRTNSSLSLGLGIPSLVLSVILLFVVISQIKKNKLLTARIEQLEKKMQAMPFGDQEMPVLMNVPLMSANSLQQDHEEIQQQPMVVQPPTTHAVPEQQPTTIPQYFPQFVQQQQLPPQFRNAQPYPFAYPQVVFAQPPQTQPIQQQQQQQTQSKQ